MSDNRIGKHFHSVGEHTPVLVVLDFQRLDISLIKEHVSLLFLLHKVIYDSCHYDKINDEIPNGEVLRHESK